jgi:hypothetical protein
LSSTKTMPQKFGIYDHFENAGGLNLSLGQMWEVILEVIIHWQLLTLIWFFTLISGSSRFNINFDYKIGSQLPLRFSNNSFHY